METYLDITKGLHTDFEPIDQPQGTYRYLKNAVRQVSGAIENEKGTSLTIKFIEDDRRVLGSYVLDSDTILFSYAPSTDLSEIGVLNTSGVYTTITNDASLAFSLEIIIRAEGKRNYKGERIIYFTGKGLPMRVLNIDNLPSSDFDDNTKLVLTANMPQITGTSVINGGTLPSGIYQFGVRLLTKSTNSTSVSLLTNPIPVNDEEGLDRDSYDGAPPQTSTNKAISINVSNVDVDYEYLEIIAITYISTSNTLQANVVARVPIQSRSNIDFIYSSTSQIKEAIDINALAVDQSNYDSAEFIIQKDGILILAGLTSSVSDYNFQPAANSISVKYSIKEVVWNENIQISNGIDTGTSYMIGDDYKNPSTVLEFKSYMRSEVYSFAISPIFKNWSVGSAYHIPAPVVSSNGNPIPGNTEADSTTKVLGTFTSTELYPTGKGYPDSLINRVRHHRMPSLIQEPHVQVRNGTTYIRMLGIKVDLSSFLSTIPLNIKKDIIGYVITKQKRDDDNRSILTQGVATTHVSVKDNNYSPVPFSGKWPTYNSIPGSTISSTFSTSEVLDQSIVAFYSPETIITREDEKSATRLRPVLELSGTSYAVRDNRAGGDKFAYLLMNYNASTSNTTILNTIKDIDTSLTQYISAGAEKTQIDIRTNLPNQPLVSLNKSIVTWRNPGYLFLKLSNGDLPSVNNLFGDGKGEVFYKFEDSATDGLYLNNNQSNQGTTTRHLYNLSKERPRQYGAIYEAKYHYVKHVTTNNIPVNSVIECFNGDVFITKFSVMSSMNPGVGNNVEKIVDLKSISYFWVESTINCGYRHYKQAIGVEGDDNYEQGTLPYYPKTKVLSTGSTTNLGLFEYSSSLGHPIGYNKQYSFENTIRQYYPVALETEQVTDFPNRLIYSEESVEGEQLDAFRVFLANNYHDIPKEKGHITNLFTLSNNLYVHTERSIWRTYFNNAVTQINSEGEAYLGNGGIFNRPSTPILNIKGGYGGTNSSCGCSTPFGHFFVDTNNRKTFLFTDGDDPLVEISDQGMFKEFKSKIDFIANQPALGSGYTSIYDYTNKRWLLTNIGKWTISYSPQLKSWSSWHDYLPYHYISNGDRVFSVNTNEVHEHNTGTHGVYYGNIPASTQIDIVINDAAHQTKTFDNLMFYTTSDKNGIEQHYDTFSTLHCYNNTRNTGKCRLVVPRTFNDEFVNLGLFECFAKLKSNEFRVSIPCDLILDVERSIFDPNNLGTTRDYRPSMSGKYMIASLSYNNLRDNKFVLHNIGRLFRQRIR